jgi:hypothetical protein
MERSDVDEVMRHMQATFDQAQLGQIRPLSVRMGVVERQGLSVAGTMRLEKKGDGCGEGN